METCDLCGKEYEDDRALKVGKPRRYCSKTCRVRAQRLKAHYNLDPADYQRMMEDQGGICAICKEPMTEPHVDHDHETGCIRGLLCSTCNVGLGSFKDNLDWLEEAAEYLKEHAEGRYPQNKLKSRLVKCLVCRKTFVQTRADKKACGQRCSSQLWRQNNREQYLETRREYYKREGK